MYFVHKHNILYYHKIKFCAMNFDNELVYVQFISDL